MTYMKKAFAGAILAAGIIAGAPLAAFAEEAPASQEAPAAQEAQAAPAALGMPNPIVQYRTIPELELAIGFPVFYLPANLNTVYHPAVSIYGIHGLVADLRFKSNRDESTLMVRSALIERVKTEDISGHHSVSWTEIDAGDMKHTKIKLATIGPDSYSAHWKADRFTYSIDMNNIDKETFLRYLKAFVMTGDKFAYKYRNFTLNVHNVEKIMQEAEAVSNPEAAAQQQAAAAQKEQAQKEQQPKEWYF